LTTSATGGFDQERARVAQSIIERLVEGEIDEKRPGDRTPSVVAQRPASFVAGRAVARQGTPVFDFPPPRALLSILGAGA